ncbi:MAG: hypothetical protein A3D74_04225 [Candidatus Levybacteria bacterium RIFCSPHIGHO2_02_FULL_37_13]|nr:MAG: hypothetical protein A3D74_04225 [Candidatus Levybacteria bacterium RIFCSPHIGHO2_02_FULL_37_13]OGH29308.1 MAG: hypothetical protein A3E40_00170 [Candidatus Levybacteria bacterium RIFCSPHIGHO2_12_FULL_37_9]OGH39757.1 MAG: hypothetical protein A3B41_04200 [Candidatus Levybacteria bacterium RIFCSPLOWO2_01_FULL_37_26]
MTHSFFHYVLTIVFEIFKAVVGSSYWYVIGFVGFLIFRSKMSPFDLVIGLPLLIVGIGVAVNSLETVFLAIFSPKYNKGICRLCDKS